MFDYALRAPIPQAPFPIWSQLTLQPLCGHVLTPFSFSVMQEVAGRAWYAYYDRLGFNPPAHPQLVRRHQGRLYVNESVSARLDAENAGLSAPQVRVDGQLVSLYDTEKAGFWVGFKQGRAQRKIDEVLAALEAEMDAAARKAETWYRKTRELRWTQAEVLQVMEEIVRVATPGMTAFFAARHGLLSLYNSLILATLDRCPYPGNLTLINAAVCDLDDLAELKIARAVVDLARGIDAETLAWLRRGDLHSWQETMPSVDLAEGVGEFLTRFGHRAIGEGEMSNPRWGQDPSPLFRSLAACHDKGARQPARLPSQGGMQKLLEAIGPGQQKALQQTLVRMRRLLQLQSRSLDVLACGMAGTRLWALAAAKEAMADGRLRSPDEVFMFEIEEMKQMMTGEWNVSDLAGIHATVAHRRAELEAWRHEQPGELLLGDVEAMAVRPGLPAVGGHATGPLRRWAGIQSHGCTAAIVGIEQMDAGCALALPVAEGFVAAHGTPVDAIVAAARSWHTPAVVGLGAAYHRLVEGAQTSVDGDAGAVDQ